MQLRFSGITLLYGATSENIQPHMTPITRQHNGVMALQRSDEESGLQKLTLIYGKELHLFTHDYWGKELSNLVPRTEAQGIVNQAMTPYNQDHESFLEFAYDVDRFVEHIEAQSPQSVTRLDLTA